MWRTLSMNHLIAVGIVAFFLCISTNAYAQFAGNEPAQLALDPLYPEPFSSVTVSLEAYSMDTTGATIQWYVDGTEQTSARNARSLMVRTGELDDAQTVTVRITRANASPFSISKSIVPSAVDLIIESKTYVPAFYKGRALPSSDAHIRVIAIPHTATNEAPASYTYEWKQGDTVLFGGPVKGKYAAEMTMSRYDGDFLSVRVTDAKGRAVGGKTMILNPANTELLFYEDNPLRGLHERAIMNTLTLIGEETTVLSAPYYMATDLSPLSTTFDWKINDTAVAPDPLKPYALTLRKTGAGGSARIGLNALTTTQIPQYVQGGFNVTF